MKNIYTSIRYFMFLLLVVCISSCNKDGFTTLVIEDGQPSVAQMIIGQWTPDHVEWADEDGNVLERPEMPDIPDLNFDEGGTGTFGGNGSGSFDWTVDEGSDGGMGSGYHGEGPSITFGGERWYIFQLTKTILIIYRITDRYVIIYYYYRVGEYEGAEPTPEPSSALISEIRATTTYESGSKSSTTTYRFSYDDQDRIQNYSIDNGNYTYEWVYRYNGSEEVYVTGSESYKAYISKFGIQSLYSLSSAASKEVLVATSVYDENGYLQTLNNNVFGYEHNNLVELNCRGSIYNYEYSDEKNDANLDLNCIISNCSEYEYDYSHFSLFAPFGFYGERSANMISRMDFGQYADGYYVYSYERDLQGRIDTITCYCMDKWNEGNVFNSTVYEIFYE